MVLQRCRSKCPDTFTADTVLSCLESCESELAPKIARCRAGQECFLYSFSVKPYDKQALLDNRQLLASLLAQNEAGVFNKGTINKGLCHFSAKHSGFLTHQRAPSYIADQGYVLQHMLLTVKGIKKNTSTGVRLPTWLKDLTDLLPAKCDKEPTGQPTPLPDAPPARQSSTPLPDAPPARQSTTLCLGNARVEPTRKFILRRVSSTASASSATETVPYADAGPYDDDDVVEAQWQHEVIGGVACAASHQGDSQIAIAEHVSDSGFMFFFLS